MSEESPDIERAREGVHEALEASGRPMERLIGSLETWCKIIPENEITEQKRVQRLLFRSRNLEAIICKLGGDVDK